MPTPGEAISGGDEAAHSYRVAADALRRCLTLADVAMEYGSTTRAAEYVLGALDDLAPDLAILKTHLRR